MRKSGFVSPGNGLGSKRIEQATSSRTMKHTIYEDPVIHKFALLRLPKTFKDGVRLLIPPVDRWFETRAAAVAALSEPLNQPE